MEEFARPRIADVLEPTLALGRDGSEVETSGKPIRPTDRTMPPAAVERARVRILFTSYTTEWVGPTNSLLHLLRGMKDDFDVSVLLPGRGDFSRTLEAEEIPFFSVPRLDKWSIPTIVRILRAESYDLLYANNHSGSSRNAVLAARLAGVPSICHIREMIGQGSWRRFWFLRMPSAVVAVSRAAARDAARFVPSSRLHVVHNGIDLREFDVWKQQACAGPSSVQDMRELLGLPPRGPLILAVSHVCRRKGQLLMLEALKQLSPSVSDAHLALVGSLQREPEYVERVRRRACELGVEDRLHLLGFRRDVPRILSAGDVFLHTALADPHPRSVLEAMAARLPVVAFSTDGVAETVVDGITGRLVPSGDTPGLATALVSLLENADARRRMGRAGRRRIEKHFTSQSATEGVKRVIGSVLPRSAERRGQ